MKLILSKIISSLVKFNFSWSILNSISKLGEFIKHKRGEYENQQFKNWSLDHEKSLAFLCNRLFKSKTVLHGPFRGMKYSEFTSVGSELTPKLMGSYEKEIEGILELLCSIQYSEIIDIGCAEGYYAVGFGIRNHKAKIFAYDTSEQARSLCYKMAQLNNLEKRIIIESECTPDILKNFSFTGRALIICDCEGYEKYLFNSTNISNLSCCDILIEMHDFIDRSISLYLIGVFRNTHAMSIVNSIDDSEKHKLYYFYELKDEDNLCKKAIFNERRPELMQWLFLTPHKSHT